MHKLCNVKIKQVVIPPKTECMMRDKCNYKNSCWHEGEKHETEFRCAELNRLMKVEIGSV